MADCVWPESVTARCETAAHSDASIGADCHCRGPGPGGASVTAEEQHPAGIAGHFQADSLH